MVVAVSAGLAWVNPTAAKYCWVLIPDRAVGRGAPVLRPACAGLRTPGRCKPAVNDPSTTDGRRRPRA